jgi:hypothetical protein
MWAKFEAWIARHLPGWKVKALNLMSAVYNAAILTKAMIDESGIQQIVEQKTLITVTIVVNILTIWLRDIAVRVAERQAKVNAELAERTKSSS